MDIEVLIDAVRERRPIWDASSKLHSNRDCIRKLWNEISHELDIDCEDAKKRWRGLRENYRKELQKKRTTQAAGYDWKSKWSYYDSISFLHDQFASRKTSGSPGPGVHFPESHEDSKKSSNGMTNNEEEEKEEEEGRGADTNEIIVDISSAGTSTCTNRADGRAETTQKRPASPVNSKDQRSQRSNTNKKSLLQKMVQLEGKKVAEYIERRPTTQEIHDADYHFLMSLLPSLRAIPAHRKMVFRRKVEYLFLKEEDRNAQVDVFRFGVARRPSSAASDDTIVSQGQSVGTSVEDLSPCDDQTKQQFQGNGQDL